MNALDGANTEEENKTTTTTLNPSLNPSGDAAKNPEESLSLHLSESFPTSVFADFKKRQFVNVL